MLPDLMIKVNSFYDSNKSCTSQPLHMLNNISNYQENAHFEIVTDVIQDLCDIFSKLCHLYVCVSGSEDSDALL